MEQVIAYKAFNGRLFDTEDKCIAYEKKLSQYPKVKETTIKADDSYITNKVGHGEYVSTDIVQHVIETWEKPSSSKKVDIYYIVGGKYKFIDIHGKHGASLMNNGSAYLFNTEDTSTEWYLGAKHFAEQILKGHELTDDFISNEIKQLNELNRIHSKYCELTAEVIEPNKMWKIDNPRWLSGAVAPYTFTIEKID